jgi:small subunit ribosomal protein S16
MVVIRLARGGAKKRPFFNIVVADSRNRRDGRFIEELGYYDPLTSPANIKLDEELIFKWLKCGAILSENVEGLMRRTGSMKKWQFVRDGVATDQVDAKVAAVVEKETKGLTADERRHKFTSKRVSKKKAAAAAKPAAEGA